MIYSDFKGLKLSRLGFGAMRLPLLADGSIDEPQTAQMVRIAIENGVNYFDTAHPYHGGMSERVLGRVLKDYPRESYFLATKYPGHQISASYDPKQIFEEQLVKCGVDYFDFYLLHNVCENSMGVYTDPRWGIVDYFAEQRRLGRIKHLGFSSHGRPENLREFLDRYGDVMEFCQIQLNYVDWTLQDAKAKYELLTERGIPVWVMEPVRGGKLAALDGGTTEKLRALRPDDSTAAWAFRWLWRLPNVAVILSGMSDLEQMRDNVKTFCTGEPLSDSEAAMMLDIAEQLKCAVPCTGCRYCCAGCPMELDIPMLLQSYSDAKFQKGTTVSMHLDTLPADKLPTACIGCGACSAVCPQSIDIPAAMKDFAALMPTLPDWTAISRQREEEAKRNRA